MILVTGASGHLAQAILHHLKEPGVNAVGGTRTPGNDPRQRLLDFDDPDTLDFGDVGTLVILWGLRTNARESHAKPVVEHEPGVRVGVKGERGRGMVRGGVGCHGHHVYGNVECRELTDRIHGQAIFTPYVGREERKTE